MQKDKASETEKEFRRRFASLGGCARAKKLSKKRRVEIATKASHARHYKEDAKNR